MPRALGLAAYAVGCSLVWAMAWPPPAVTQPLAFDHARHAGVACAVCHAGIESSSRAGLPPPAVCVACHASAPGRVDGRAWEALSRAASRPWTPVTRLPEHTWFSHRRHVALARLDCASCHGDVGRRTTPPPRNPVRLAMSDCVACHRHEGASEDCAACHR